MIKKTYTINFTKALFLKFNLIVLNFFLIWYYQLLLVYRKTLLIIIENLIQCNLSIKSIFQYLVNYSILFLFKILRYTFYNGCIRRFYVSYLCMIF